MDENNLINFKADDEIFFQRVSDGYFNATALCKAVNKRFNNYLRLENTDKLVEVIARSTGIRADILIQITVTGVNELRGSWIHPKIAINLAQWLSPEFADKISDIALNWMSGKHKKSAIYIPNQMKRYIYNKKRVPKGLFSISQETGWFISELEDLGCRIPRDKLIDGSIGRAFCTYLKNKGIDTDNFQTYPHSFGDFRKDIYPKAIPYKYLAEFKNFVDFSWLPLPDYGFKYFKKNFPDGLPYFKKFLQERDYDTSMFNSKLDFEL